MQKLSSLPKYLLPRLRDILFFGILFTVVLNGPRFFNQDGDLGRHITIGNYILNTGVIPTSDIFSHTMRGAELTPHEWLAQVALALAHRAMGLSGDVFLFAAIVSTTFLIVYDEIIKRGVFRLVAMLVTITAVSASAIHWLVRPHAFTFLFVALWTYGLEQVYQGKDAKLWRLPLLMMVWANMHGAFIAGFVVWGAYAAEWTWDFLRGCASNVIGKRLALTGLFSFSLTFVNPVGWRLWATSVGYIGSKYLVDHTVEYMSPNFHDKPMWFFLFMLAFALFALAGERRLPLRETLLLAGWAIMGLYSARNIPLFAIIVAPIYGELIQAWAQRNSLLVRLDAGMRKIESQLRGNFWILASILIIGFAAQNNSVARNQYDATQFPVQAVNWALNNPQDGNMFNDFKWGGYILYRLWPRQTVFIDGQTDFYGEALTREYERVITLSANWEDVLKKYNIKWILIPQGSPLANHLMKSNRWKILYQDETAVILRKP